MPVYRDGARVKKIPLAEFLIENVGIEKDLATLLIANWNPASNQSPQKPSPQISKDESVKKYRTFWRRFWAGSVDGLVLMPIVWFLGYLENSISMPVFVLITSFANALLAHAYNVILHAKYGQTLGKFFFKVKVFDITQSKLSYKQALLRDSVPIILGLIAYTMLVPHVLDGTYPFDNTDPNLREKIDLIPMMLFAFVSSGWFFLEVVTMLTNKKRRAIHDFIARSVVTMSERRDR